MVYFFTSNVIDPPATIYVGKDKFESPFSPSPTPHSLPSVSPARAPKADGPSPARRRTDQIRLGLRYLVTKDSPSPPPHLLSALVPPLPHPQSNALSTGYVRPPPPTPCFSPSPKQRREKATGKGKKSRIVETKGPVPRRQPLLRAHLPPPHARADMGCVAEGACGRVRAVDQGEFD